MATEQSSPVVALIQILSIAMVLSALGIVAVASIQRMIKFYQFQSIVLAVLTAVKAIETGPSTPRVAPMLVLFAVVIPGMLAYLIEPLLAQATVPQESTAVARIAMPLLRFARPTFRRQARQSIDRAIPVWLEHGLTPPRQVGAVSASLMLTAFSYVLAFALMKGTGDPARSNSLAVALTLLMLGLFTMINRQDLISQILGLLVMDHGLFLAVVLVMQLTSLIPYFVVGLLLYILITLMILVILLPGLHAESESIEVGQQNQLKG